LTLRHPKLYSEKVACGGEGCAKLAPGHRLVVRTDAVQHSPFLDGDVWSSVAGQHHDNEEASRRISLARHCEQLNAERFIYTVPGRLHCLLLNCAEVLLVQGRSAVCLVGTYAEDENPTTDVSQGTKVLSQIIYVVKLPLEVKVPGLAGSLIDQALDTRQGFNVGGDAEPREERIHGLQGSGAENVRRPHCF
jgi:hypothetical protein